MTVVDERSLLDDIANFDCEEVDGDEKELILYETLRSKWIQDKNTICLCNLDDYRGEILCPFH